MTKKIILTTILLLLPLSPLFAASIPKVKNVQIQNRYDKSIKLKWKKQNNIKYYKIRVLKKKNNKFKISKTIKTKKNVRRKLIKKLTPEKKYFFRLKACKKKKCGKWSKRKKGTTLQLLQNRLDFLYGDLHIPESGNRARENFPDLKLTHTDPAHNGFPDEILPFRYYYSKEAKRTIAICNIDYTVFFCTKKLTSLISKNDLDVCEVSSAYYNIDDRLH